MTLLQWNLHPQFRLRTSALTKMGAHTLIGFPVSLLYGPIQAPPGVSIPALPLTVLQAIGTNTTYGLQSFLMSNVDGVLHLLLLLVDQY